LLLVAFVSRACYFDIALNIYLPHSKRGDKHQRSLDFGLRVVVTIWKLGRTVCVYSMAQRREKENDPRYIQEASAPAAVTMYQTCNIMYIGNSWVV
jgi:hypothetical protein